MKSFIIAFREYIKAQTLQETKPILMYLNGEYIVTWYYSESTIKRIGGEIIL